MKTNNTTERPGLKYDRDRLFLVSNDDGIFSPGIRTLADIASIYGEVKIIAPDRQQSAVGHSITVMDPLRVARFEMKNDMIGYAVNGTPADCIKLAHDQLLDRQPTMILSGINHGSNAGINIIYSGTVSAATEGTVLGYPSVAISCTDFQEDADLTGCRMAAERVIEYVIKFGLPKGVTLNVNVPSGPLKGLKWTRQGDSRYVEQYQRRIDPNDKPYYWITGRFEVLDQGEDLDVNVLKQGFASVTPIQYDLTAHRVFDEVRSREF
jgi:5'-nucleotidase